MSLKHLWLCWVLLGGCNEAAPLPGRFEVTLHAGVPGGSPLAGVRFWSDGRELGVSDSRGSLSTTLVGAEGTEVRVAAICPPGYVGDDEARILTLRKLASRAAATAADALSVTVQCTPQQRIAALVVLARLGNAPLRLPVLVDGQRVADTGADGTAHVLVPVGPSGRLRVALDTGSAPHLVPKQPLQSFEAQAPENLLLFEPQLQRRRLPPERPKPPEPQKRIVPYRIQ